MKLPSFRRLFKGDYDEKDQQLVEKLSVSLNNGIDVLYNTLNKNASLKDNIFCTVKDISIQVGSTGTPTLTTGFKLDFTSKLSGIQVIRAINSTNSNVYPTGQPFISYTQNADSVVINNITGLSSGYTWALKVVAYGD